MLPRADADIASRDPALPGLATLLDADALLAALRGARPGASFDGVDITYVRYRPGTTCLVGCQLDIAGSRAAAYAVTYSPSAQRRLRAGEGAPIAGRAGLLGPGRFVLADCATVVSMFPNDRKVSALPALGRPEGCTTLLEELLPTAESLRAGTLEPLVYNPERRFVGKLVGCDGPQAVLKLYSDRGYRDAHGGPRPFTSRGPLRVAGMLARSDRHRTAVFEWLGGRLLSEAILDPAFDANIVVTVGKALAELHAHELTGLTRVTPGATAEGLRAEATIIGCLCPALDARAHDLAERLGARLLDQPPVYRPLHGDFHPRQVVLGAGTVGFLDFDAAFDGDPTYDLASFLARVERAVIRGSLSHQRAERLAQALLNGYEASTGRSMHERMPLVLAVVLFRLARRCFRCREPDWPNLMGAMLERAEAVTARAPRRPKDNRGHLPGGRDTLSARARVKEE